MESLLRPCGHRRPSWGGKQLRERGQYLFQRNDVGITLALLPQDAIRGVLLRLPSWNVSGERDPGGDGLLRFANPWKTRKGASSEEHRPKMESQVTLDLGPRALGQALLGAIHR